MIIPEIIKSDKQRENLLNDGNITGFHSEVNAVNGGVLAMTELNFRDFPNQKKKSHLKVVK